MPHRRLLLAAALLASLPVLAAKPVKPPVAPSFAKVCEECHGGDGVSPTPGVPHLDGQLPDNIVEAIRQFKEGKRPSSTPEHNNPGLTTKGTENIAKYYNFQKGERPAQATDPAKVAAAEALYERRCSKCHVEGGRESDHDAPLMAGQSLEYLQAQTNAFVTGKRKFPFLMDEAYQGLTPEDLDRLSHYFASQKR